MTIDSLRSQHRRFIYQAFSYQLTKVGLEITFDFLLEPNIQFQPQLTLEGVTQETLDHLPAEQLNNLVFNLGLIEIPSYWKCACSPEICVQAGSLSAEQIAWWQDLFIKGMGEFYFTNQIDFTQPNFVQIVAESHSDTAIGKPSLEENQYSQPYLIPIGGGKDSSLTLGLLDQASQSYGCLVLKPASPAALTLAQQSNAKQIIIISRKIDPKLLELNKQGYLNGHTPFSAYLSFVSTLIAQLFGYQQILVANEQSANQANLTYLNLEINHQYSKSLEYETNFRQYAQKYLGSKTNQAEYLSFLRPLYEIQIAKLFSQFPQYFTQFKSCNIKQQSGTWCGHCSKCLFVYLMLYPFIDTQILTQQIFDHDLFADEDMIPLALNLAGLGEHKPLECVGTYDEVQVALYLARKKYQVSNPDSQPLPPVLATLNNQLLTSRPDQAWEELADHLLTSWNNNHYLDASLVKLLKSYLT